jgi:hypothetical protein
MVQMQNERQKVIKQA